MPRYFIIATSNLYLPGGIFPSDFFFFAFKFNNAREDRKERKKESLAKSGFVLSSVDWHIDETVNCLAMTMKWTSHNWDPCPRSFACIRIPSSCCIYILRRFSSPIAFCKLLKSDPCNKHVSISKVYLIWSIKITFMHQYYDPYFILIHKVTVHFCLVESLNRHKMKDACHHYDPILISDTVA